MSERILAPIETIKKALPHPNADILSIYPVKGWQVIDQKDRYKEGDFPTFLRKADQERIQNIPEDVLQHYYDQGTYFQVTEKLDGSSCTFYHYENQWGVTSRNIDLKLDQEGNTFVDMFNTLQPILDILRTELENLGYPNFAVQGELIGGKIQGNQYKIEGYSFYVFDIFDITTQTYLHTSTVETLARICGLNHVPVIETAPLRYSTVDDFLKLAEGQSFLNNSNREGLVFKSLDRTISFKVISNSWLLTND